MFRSVYFKKLTFAGLCGVALTLNALPIAYGQTNHQPAVQSPQAQLSSKARVMVTECQGVNNCAIWTFTGWSGNGKWPTGEEANLTVKSIQGNRITIERDDFDGPTVGLHVTYTGDFDHNDVGGTFDSGDKGTHGQWYWISGDSEVSLPPVIHFCLANCFTFYLDGRRYYNSPDKSKHGVYAWTVEKFTPASIIIRRVETTATATLEGQMSADATTAQGTQTGTGGIWKNAPVGKFQASWGTSLDVVPGSNEERDRRINSGMVQPLPPITVDGLIQGAKRIRDAIELWDYFNARFSGN
jgi:hypothetical protein